jgi:cystathionine gamma-lyase
VPPISLATTFKLVGPGEHVGFDYIRTDNPTRRVLETSLAALDNGKYALAFASGSGAVNATISTLKTGEVIIASDDIYGGTNTLLRKLGQNMGIDVTFVDMTNLKNLEKAIKPNVKLVWLETPTNPTMKVIDIKGVADLVHSKSKAFVAVDNTFLTPYFQRPLELGADVVMYSLTKYMNGHSDVMMGSISTNSKELYEEIRFYQDEAGIVPSPFDCYMVNRSLKTLSLRMERHFRNSVAVAKFLESHPKITKVLHPALPSHPQHKQALAQAYGHSGMMSFYIKDADLEKSSKFFEALKTIKLAESLGSFETTTSLPTKMSHRTMAKAEREALGITDGLVRISIGLEDVNDLIEDLNQALAVV